MSTGNQFHFFAISGRTRITKFLTIFIPAHNENHVAGPMYITKLVIYKDVPTT